MSDFSIGTYHVAAGSCLTVNLPISVLANYTPISLPVHVMNGRQTGPVLFISAAVHGDEVLGVEIVKRVVASLAGKDLRGTLLAVPIVNAYGFLNQTRYMPDRRDLNRSFPGSDKGSLASLLADLFMQEVVKRSHYGIDLHSAAQHRTNLPQIRIAPDEPELLSLAKAFAPPVVVVSKLREGTLRACAKERGVKVLLYEAGEALRFDEDAIAIGVTGILRLMGHIGMIAEEIPALFASSALASSSLWLRAPEGGILRGALSLGAQVRKGEVVGEVSSPLGEIRTLIASEDDGIIIGRTNLPIVNRGDALFHLARLKSADISPVILYDEDEII